MLWSYVALFKAQREPKHGQWIFIFGLLIGATFTIKPTFILLAILLLFISARFLLHSGVNVVRYIVAGLLGLMLPSLMVTLWLFRVGAFQSFVKLAGTLIPFHAALGHRSSSYLLTHVTSPIMPLCAGWLILLFLIRPKLTLERTELLIGTACALFAYIVQGKGFSYHRYPFLAFMLLLIMMDFTDALMRDRWPRVLAIISLAFSCLAIAPRAAWLAQSFRPESPFEESLGKQLISFGPQLSGKVQCLDTFGGCINTLYDLRLVQSTGYLYDCYLFTPEQNAITKRYRNDFFEAYQKAEPRAIILTDQFCFGDQGGFKKIEAWPQLQNDMERNYVLMVEWKSSVDERWWSRSEAPPGYRIYLRKKRAGP